MCFLFCLLISVAWQALSTDYNEEETKKLQGDLTQWLVNYGKAKPIGAYEEFADKIRFRVKARANPRVSDGHPKNNSSAIHYAAQNGDEDLIKFLLENGAVVDERNANGSTPLHFACWLGDLETTVLLCESGANIDSATSSKFSAPTPLMIACESGYGDVASELIQRGANIEAQNSRGETACFYAVIKKNKELLGMLVKAGAEINIQNIAGNTPFKFSLNFAATDIAEFLLSCGADPLLGQSDFLEHAHAFPSWRRPRLTETDTRSFFERVYSVPQHHYLDILNRSSLFVSLPKELRLLIIRWILAPWLIGENTSSNSD